MLTKLKLAIMRFMEGRNGLDNIGWHAMWGGLILTLAGMMEPTGIAQLLGTALYIYAIFRLFSRNVGKRQAENARYVQFTEKCSREVKQFFLRLKGMKEYKYFRCPNCKVRLRLKRGAGEKAITCPKCSHSFSQRA